MTRFWFGLLLAVLIMGGLLYWLRRQRHAQDYPDAQTLLQHPNVDAVVTRIGDNGYHLRWVVPAERVTIYTGTSPDHLTHQLTTVNGASSVTLPDITPTQPRYFKLAFDNGTHIVTAERELDLQGAVNFRDVGGYRTAAGRYVRWGRVYRAGQLADLTERDLELLQAIGLKISCDLRLNEEVAEEPDRLPASVRYEPVPIQSSESRSKQVRRLLFARGRLDQFMTRAYTRVIVDNNADVYARVFEMLADADNLPLVLHCTAGKDRTGVGVALLLALLGVPDDVIAADYSLSNRYFETYVAIGERAIQSVGRLGWSVETLLPLFTANPETILDTLAHVRATYGSVEGYLTKAGGVHPQTLAQVREHMLL